VFNLIYFQKKIPEKNFILKIIIFKSFFFTMCIL